MSLFVRMSKDDLRIILRDLGSIIFIIGYVLLLPLIIAYAAEEQHLYLAFIYPSFLAIWIGFFLRKKFKKSGETLLKHAMINAGLAWIIISLIGTFPYWYYGMGLLNSYFESMSGFTTTGMTLISNVETLPKCILFWRSLTQWIGGVGVIMLFMVILLQSRIVMSRFYFAEGRSERIKPGISSTVKVIWKIYIFLTIIGISLYFIAGMNFFDSVNHALTTLATSGYSTKNASIASFDSIAIELVAIILMLVGGISFVVHFKILEGDKKELINNPEVKAFLTIIFAGITLIFLNLIGEGYPIERALRLAAFQAVSVGTTTGYSITSIDNFPDFSKFIFLFLMFTGACAGSTGGGFKVLRVIILIKLGYQEVMKSILPEKAVVPFKLRDKIIEDRDMIRLAGLFFLYLFALFLSAMLFTLTGYKPIESISLAFSSMFNIGPTLINPTDWFNMGSQTKIILIIGMWIGRLEIFPAFALISSLLIISRREKRSI